MKTLQKYKNIFIILLLFASLEGTGQITIQVQQKTNFSDFGTVWVEYIYLNINGAHPSQNFPFVLDFGTTQSEAESKKSVLINALKTNIFNNLTHNIWNPSDDCSKALFAYRHDSDSFVEVVVQVANTGIDSLDFASQSYNWIANSKGISEAKAGIMLDRKIVSNKSDLVKISAFINCPSNTFKTWIQTIGDSTKRNLQTFNNTHFSVSGIDTNVNVYISCPNGSQSTFTPLQFSPKLTKLELKTTQSQCQGTNRMVSLLPSGGAGKYDFFVDGTNPSDSNTSPSDPNHCNGLPDYLYYSSFSPPGQTGISLTAGQTYNLRLRDAYQEIAFPVTVDACATACEDSLAWESISATKCGKYTTIAVKTKEVNKLPLATEFSIDNKNWFDANAEANQYKFTVVQTNTQHPFWARIKGCLDSTRILTGSLSDTSSYYYENCREPCSMSLNLAFDKSTVTVCGNQSTFTLNVMEKHGYPFIPEFSYDEKATWYPANVSPNQFRFSLTQNNTCRDVYIKPAGCENDNQTQWGCFKDTDPSYSYTPNCDDPCTLNLEWDKGTATTCGNNTTFTIKVKEKNGFPFTAQFSLDSLHWFDANISVNQYLFTVVRQNVCHSIFVRVKGCTDPQKTIWGCFSDTNAGYPIDCEENLLPTEPTEKNSLIVSPNPTNRLLNVAFFRKTSGHMKLSIQDILGRELISQNFEGNIGKNYVNLDLGALPPEIYFLVIHSNEGIITKKIVKIQ